MRSFPLPDGSNCSALGFGCGAVMGRVGKPASLLAMEEAFSQGINLFDTARSYGMGQAEAVLGEFLRGKRSQAIVSTKFGISADAISEKFSSGLFSFAQSLSSAATPAEVGRGAGGMFWGLGLIRPFHTA